MNGQLSEFIIVNAQIADEDVTVPGAVVAFGDTVQSGMAEQVGIPGPPGPPGADGFSPIATVEKSGSVATITITDKNGTTTAQVSDGAEGPEGPAGPGIPTGGTAGQFLVKASSADYDTAWVTVPNANGEVF